MTDRVVDIEARGIAAHKAASTTVKRFRGFDARVAPTVLTGHAIAALAVFPWFFSWTGVVLLLTGIIVFGTLGINIGYHRLLTHKGFSCPRWLEYTLAIVGLCSLQEAPACWAAIHRRHHQFADEDEDPHSPVVSFFWAHMGWVLKGTYGLQRATLIDRYAKDLLRQPFYAWLEKRHRGDKIVLASWLVYFLAGFGVIALSGASLVDAAQFGLSLLVWGAALRTVMVWHITWSVNSVTHVWGYRNYQTPDSSRNNPVIGIMAGGEGWHNNHHADPRSARHGHKWWEFDLAWLIIWLLERLGLVWNVARPSQIVSAKFNAQTPD
jgi:stearoyl-CoA desaturase (delta-9 desaturase)